MIRRTVKLTAVLLTATAATAAVFASGVVSLSPAVTETICAIGGEKLLCGRSTACDYPESVKEIPAAGELGKPNVEAVLLLHPDLVVSDTAYPRQNWELLKFSGVQTLILDSKTLEDYPRNVAELGRRLKLEAGAKTEIDRFRRRLEELQRIRPENPPSVLVLFSINPLITCGKSSFVSRIVAVSGGRNLGDDFGDDYFALSAEQLALSPPDVVVLTGMEGGSETLRDVPGAASWPAVKNRRIISDISPDELCRLGPRTPDGAAALQRALFPEKIPASDASE